MVLVDVVLSDEARTYVAEHGGVVHVRPHAHRCCTGQLTLLDTSTEAPDGDGTAVAFAAGDLSVRYHGKPEAGPGLLSIELRGRLRRHLVAFWDGCAYKA